MDKIELPLDINHICRRGGSNSGPWPLQNPPMGIRENLCPGCTYERGYLDAEESHE